MIWGGIFPLKMDYSSHTKVCLLEKSVGRSCGHCYARGQSPLTLKYVCVCRDERTLTVSYRIFAPLIDFGHLMWQSAPWCSFLFAVDDICMMLI